MSGTSTASERSRPAPGEAVLERAFRILRAFSNSGPRPLTLAALATRAELPKTTVHRLTAQLVEVGALERTESGSYVIGLQLLELASMGPRAYGLRTAALPFLEDLHNITRQHVLLAVREDEEAVLVERLSARDATAVKYRVGGRLPLAETGIGIALLAHSPEELRLRHIERSEALNADSPLRSLIATVRKEGVCSVTGPNPAGQEPAMMCSVAAPILSRRGALLGAVSLVTPTTEQEATRIALRMTSLAIARRMDAAKATRSVTN